MKYFFIIMFVGILSFSILRKDPSNESEKQTPTTTSTVATEVKKPDVKEVKQKIADEFIATHNKNILKKWDQLELHDENKWVEYSNNYDRKTKVDFENKVISIELLLDKNSNTQGIANSLTKSIYSILLRTTSEANNTINPKKYNVVEAPQIDYIIGDIFDINSKSEASYRSKQIFHHSKISSTVAKNKNKVIVKATFSFPEDGISKKAQKYRATMIKHAKKNGLPVKLIYAITKVESHFNPMARSHVPAYGLMQIVPHTSGKDITKRLEGKERLLTPDELYNGYKNIEYGSIYLNILFHHYLKHIEDETSRLYCTIAGYNTGVGNVAKAFTGHYSMRSAAVVINSMSSEDVYNKLVEDLPYVETKYYLRRARGFLYEYE